MKNDFISELENLYNTELMNEFPYKDILTDWTFKRINAQATMDENNMKFTEQEYVVLTKRMRVIEELLRVRLGYEPDRITEKMMGECKEKMEKKYWRCLRKIETAEVLV